MLFKFNINGDGDEELLEEAVADRAILLLIAVDKTSTQVLQQRLRQLVLLDSDDFLEALCLALAVIVEEDFETEGVVLVLSQREAIVGDEEAVVAGTIAVE